MLWRGKGMGLRMRGIGKRGALSGQRVDCLLSGIMFGGME